MNVADAISVAEKTNKYNDREYERRHRFCGRQKYADPKSKQMFEINSA